MAADSVIPLCDIRKAFCEYLQKHNPENLDKGILTYDGVHMTAAGNQLIASSMAEAIGGTLEKK